MTNCVCRVVADARLLSISSFRPILNNDDDLTMEWEFPIDDPLIEENEELQIYSEGERTPIEDCTSMRPPPHPPTLPRRNFVLHVSIDFDSTHATM